MDIEKSWIDCKISKLAVNSFPEDGIKLKFPFLHPIGYNYTPEIGSKEIIASTEHIRNFLCLHFPHSLTPSRIEIIVGAVIPFCAWTYPPQLPAEYGPPYRIYCLIMCLALILDDIFDDPDSQIATMGREKEDRKRLIEIMNKCLDLEAGTFSDCADEDELFLKTPFVQQVLSAVRTVLKNVEELCKENFKYAKTTLFAHIGAWVQAHGWSKADNLDKYSESCYRSFRIKEFGGFSMVIVISVVSGIKLPPYLTSHPQVRHLMHLCESICCIQNDVLGVWKDVVDKEGAGSMILHKVKNGVEICEAIRTEVEHMSIAIDDYILVRASLLASYEGHTELERFVDVMDNFIVGHMFAVAYSQRYSAEGVVQLTQDWKPIHQERT